MPEPATITIRPATEDDADRVAAIYNEGIEERASTFETHPRRGSDVRAWLHHERPFLVAVGEDGAVVGFARVGHYSDRAVYRGIGEHAVYVARASRGRGIGRRLLDELCAESTRRGFHKLTSRVFVDNAASLAAHRASGFEEVGTQRRHALLDGIWRDCVLVERLLGEAAD